MLCRMTQQPLRSAITLQCQLPSNVAWPPGHVRVKVVSASVHNCILCWTCLWVHAPQVWICSVAAGTHMRYSWVPLGSLPEVGPVAHGKYGFARMCAAEQFESYPSTSCALSSKSKLVLPSLKLRGTVVFDGGTSLPEPFLMTTALYSSCIINVCDPFNTCERTFELLRGFCSHHHGQLRRITVRTSYENPRQEPG